ncbi:MAG: DUF3299 domain-containing protein [Nitrosomonas sp.]|nr:MAG: DUF3299 domain-containing protein [Nitrosomonas sp.]
MTTAFIAHRPPHSIRSGIARVALVWMLLTGCSQNPPDGNSPSDADAKPPRSQPQAITYRTIEWVDLMPQDDLEALLNPPEYLDQIEDGSDQDQLPGQFQLPAPLTGDDRYQQALQSTRIMPEFDQQEIRIPGFIVPLEFSKDQYVTRFFLVPYFGACIHVPPPPPNQIIYGIYNRGIKIHHLHEAFWLTGTLTTTLMQNNIATSTYTLHVVEITPYEDE